ALLCATRAPSYYLKTNPAALETRVDFYLNQMATAGLISNAFAEAVRGVPLEFLSRAPAPEAVPFVERKATNAIRTRLMRMLDISNLYDLDRLPLTAETTLNVRLQSAVLDVFDRMKDRTFVESQGLKTEHLLITGNPANVTYSFTFFERTPLGNA